MLKIFQSLFGRETARFRSQYQPAEAALRLQSVVKRLPFFIRFSEEETLVGRVAVENVVVYRQRPLQRNSFVPLFRGTFQVQNGITTLDGYFTIHWFPKVFMVFWLVMAFSFSVTAWAMMVKQNVQWVAAVPFIIGPIAMAVVGLLIAHVGIRWAHNDREYISEVIENAISRSA